MCKEVIPRVENRIERQLLNELKQNLKSEEEKFELEQAYLQRKDNVNREQEPFVGVKHDAWARDGNK